MGTWEEEVRSEGMGEVTVGVVREWGLCIRGWERV